ncbi:hypothetical protein GCM10007907_10120 [Chitinimonas prasina]|uniref:Acyltransferase MbtK/IucB-like conserved domain-containing protein n=1 Tax=Chitinimonas prasina TaxID=1434937 RepID=A0ABQ5YF43_9NEIS|nr:GNAT family N-acetyltransferase [Chitinimonas prasina]GLR12222.1 hypothetical protein GCM10007907_10120 [Chitinimonas prasina]
MNTYTLTLPNGHLASAEWTDDKLYVLIRGEQLAALQLSRPAADRIVLIGALPLTPHPLALMPALALLFCRDASLQEVRMELACPRDFALDAVRHGVATSMQAMDSGWALSCSRSTFWQQPALWLTAPASAGMALDYVMTGEKRHPRRAPKPEGVVYRRYLPELDSVYTMRVASVAQDLAVFHDWMNQDRVHRFWELAGDRDAHASYLQTQLDDPKTLPLIAEFDGEPFAYFETYWAKEDRLAPYYDAQDFDRGCHVLVGNSQHRGPAKVTVWIRAICHYLFLDDPRTQRIVGEPRVDNVKFISYVQSQGFAKCKEFNFPHKRAAMMLLEREAFFDQYGPWGEQ